MATRSAARLIGIATVAMISTAQSGKPPETPLSIKVHVYNYASLEKKTLGRAASEADRIYARVGVNLEWIDCPNTPQQADEFPACVHPTSPTRLTLKVISGRMAKRLNFSRKALGRSWLPEAGGFGYVAAVSAHQTKALARRMRYSEGAILGHLIAHELGHLLLGANSHARTGIMHVPWRSEELEFVRQGTMYFDSSQAKRIRAGVRQRIAADGLTRSRSIY